MDTKKTSHYDVLNIPPHASDEDVKRAYRTMAKIYHPDQNQHNIGGSRQRFQRICDAYEALKTSEKRKTYNIKLSAQSNAANNNNNPSDESWLSQIAELFWPSKNQV